MVACDRMHGNGAHPWQKWWGGLSSAREKDLPGGGETFHMPPLSVQPAKAQALICPGWQWAKLSLIQMNPPDSCETFLKGSPAKGCGGGQLRPCSCVTSPHSLTTCCNFPPHQAQFVCKSSLIYSCSLWKGQIKYNNCNCFNNMKKMTPLWDQ